MKKNEALIEPLVEDFFHYDSKTGVLYNKKTGNTGTVVRTTLTDGKEVPVRLTHSIYIRDVINKTAYSHRIAWRLHHGEWPKQEIDHINGNPLDNRIQNLRDVDKRVNLSNRKKFSNNKSGHRGVCYLKDKKRWLAYISNNKGKQVRLGTFKRKMDAVEARLKAGKDT